MLDLTAVTKLEVSVPAEGENLALNPNGAKGAWWWYTSSPLNITVDSTPRLIFNNTVNGTTGVFETDFMRVDASMWVSARFDLTVINGWDTSAAGGLAIEWHFYNVDQTEISWQSGLGTSTSGTKYVTARQAPAGTVYVKLKFWSDFTNTGQVFALTNVMVTWKSTNSFGTYAYVEPGNFTDLFGPSTSISIDRKGLDLGLLNAEIETTTAPTQSMFSNGRAVRLRVLQGGTWKSVYEGTITDWNISYDPPLVQLQATDAVNKLASRPESRGVGTIAELPYLMEKSGVPWSINGNGNQVSSATLVSSNPNATLLDQVAITRDSAKSYAFVSRDGILKVGTPTTTSTVFTDSGSGLYYDRSIEIGESSTRVINNIMVTYLRYNTYTKQTTEVKYGPYRDNASIAKYGPKSATFTVHGITETSVTTWATDVLTKGANTVPMPSSITVPIRTTADLAALMVDLYDVVTVKYKTFNGTFAVTSVSHNITPGKWSVTFGFDAQNGVASPTVKPVAEPNYPEQTPYMERWKTAGSPQSFGTSYTTVTFQDVSSDSEGVTYGSGVFTIGRAGRYVIEGSLDFSNDANWPRVRLNAGGNTNVWNVRDKQGINFTKTRRLATGDTVFVEVQLAAANTPTSTVGGGRSQTNITLTWIGD